MGKFEHKDCDGISHRFGDVFLDPPSLLSRLIQRKVTDVHVDEGYLRLLFDDNQELSFDGTGLGENGLIQLEADLTDGWFVF